MVAALAPAFHRNSLRRADRTRTCNLRFWRPLRYQLRHYPMDRKPIRPTLPQASLRRTPSSCFQHRRTSLRNNCAYVEPASFRTASWLAESATRPQSHIRVRHPERSGEQHRVDSVEFHHSAYQLQAKNGPAMSAARVSQRISAIAESATLAVDAKAKALKAAGRPVIGFGAGRARLPHPGLHRAGRHRRRQPAEVPPLLPRRRPARAEEGHRREDVPRLRLQGGRRPRCW